MAELKTLNEIDKHAFKGGTILPPQPNFEFVKKSDLKQEAIKWVKEWKSDERLGYPTATIQINAPLALIQLELETKIDLFKGFFNITGEDLKNGKK